MQPWGRGCACHGLGVGEPCKYKGRRLSEVGAFVEVEMTRELVEANEWTPATFQNEQNDCFDLIRCVRAAFSLTCMKCSYLWKVTWLIVSILKPGVKQVVLNQWNATRPESHHRLTRYFLEPTSPLRVAIDNLAPDCMHASQLLKDVVSSSAAIPMDDSIVESPHAFAHRFQSAGRATKFAFVTSSMRLSQNLDVVRDLIAAMDADLYLEWCRYTRLLQTRPDRFDRSMK